MLIAISNYLKPLAEIDVHRPNHQTFIKKHVATSQFILAGRQTPPTGGVIIANLNSTAEFEKILAEDPYVQHGCAHYQITEFTPAFYHEALDALIT